MTMVIALLSVGALLIIIGFFMNYRSRLGEIPQDIRPEVPMRAGRGSDKLPAQNRQENPRPRNVSIRGKFSSLSLLVTDKAAVPLNINSKRVYFVIQNNGANDVFVNFGNKATITNIKVISGGNYEPFVAPIDSVSLICATGLTSLCSIVEAIEVVEN